MRPAPPRTERAKSDLRGREIDEALQAMGVSPEQFCRISGVNPQRFSEQLAETIDDDLPRYYKLVLFILYLHPELRAFEGPLPLPFEEWGITREMRRGDRPKSDMLGFEVDQALKAMNVKPAQFCRLSGANISRFQKFRRQTTVTNAATPLYYEVVLFALYHHPELRKLEGNETLDPLRKWRIDLIS